MRMKTYDRIRRAPLPLFLIIASLAFQGSPTHADTTQNTEILASDKNDVVIKVGNPIIVKDKKPAPPPKKK